MSIRIKKPVKAWCNSRACTTARRCAARLAAGAASRRVALIILLSVVVIELVLLGIGVTRRLELAYERSLDVSRAQLAVIEARELAHMEEQQNQGAVSIATAPEQNSEAPPPLRPRDVDTILSQESDWVAAMEESIGSETAESPAAPEPKSEDAAEAEQLIHQGVTALVAGDIRRCILNLEEASLLAPNHPAMLYYYGMAYDKLLNPTKAREYYTRLFRMRNAAGSYFKRAANRLTYGFDQGSAMRGKLSFGPHQVEHTYSPEEGERVKVLLPILLAPGETVRMDDIYITLQFFDLVNGRKIEFSRMAKPEWTWLNEHPDWKEGEEHLQVTYNVPPLTQEELDAYGDLRFYGFTAKLYYKDEPLDCLSTPSALILQEQRLNSRRRASLLPGNSLLPDDGLDPTFTEEALPISDFLDPTPPSPQP